ncbi:MAG TPA: hypothetical protein VF057_05850 [Thermoanaerobaculia bacterium]
MGRDALLTLVRCIAGLIAGLAFWYAFASPYNAFLGRVAQPIIRVFERPSTTRLVPRGDELTIERSDFRRGSARPAIATPVLTANFVLLAALFAANRTPWSTENVGRFLTSAVALVPIHIAAIIANVHATYASPGAWSARHYSPFARNFWGAAAHFYLVIGAFASAFLLWFLLRPSGRAGEPVRGRRSTPR